MIVYGLFELIVIVFLVGVGLRIGMLMFVIYGFIRCLLFIKIGCELMFMVGMIIILFLFVVLIEGFIFLISFLWGFKVFVVFVFSGFLMFYFVVFGFLCGGWCVVWLYKDCDLWVDGYGKFWFVVLFVVWIFFFVVYYVGFWCYFVGIF